MWQRRFFENFNLSAWDDEWKKSSKREISSHARLDTYKTRFVRSSSSKTLDMCVHSQVFVVDNTTNEIRKKKARRKKLSKLPFFNWSPMCVWRDSLASRWPQLCQFRLWNLPCEWPTENGVRKFRSERDEILSFKSPAASIFRENFCLAHKLLSPLKLHLIIVSLFSFCVKRDDGGCGEWENFH